MHIVAEVVRTLDRIAQPDPNWDAGQPDAATSLAPYRLYNIGNHQPVDLMRYIEVIEQCVGREAKKELLPLQPGDVPETYADIDALVEAVQYRPHTSIEAGVPKFVAWYRDFYHV